MTFINILIGFVMLILGSNLLVEGSVNISKKLKISTMMISMTIISIGTSMPELSIAIISSIDGNQITLSNNIGSNISTIAISLGISALLYTIYAKKSIEKEIIFMILVQLLLLGLLIIGGSLNRLDGVILLLVFIGYMIHMRKSAKKIVKEKNEVDLINEEQKYIEDANNVIRNSVITSILFIIIGLLFVVYGGNFVVNSAVEIANYFNLSEAFIGVTIVALGTTLPELSTAIVAARKKEYDIILGNVVGSGVSNFALIVGLASFIHPIHYTNTLLFQLGSLLAIDLLFYKFIADKKISKTDGLFLILSYLLFAIVSLLFQYI